MEDNKKQNKSQQESSEIPLSEGKPVQDSCGEDCPSFPQASCEEQSQDNSPQDDMTPEELTPAEMRRRNAEVYKDNLSQLPRFNLGAFCLPVIWGPANGMWITLLFYPLLIFVDSVNRGAVLSPTFVHILFACICSLVTLAFMVFFAITAQPYAYFRVAHKVSVERYKKRQKIWAVVDTVVAVAMVALATYYNLAIYLPAHM